MRDSIQKITSEHIVSVPDVQAFIWACFNELHIGFHPDTPFEDYAGDINGGAFTKDESEELNNSLDECFEVCEREKVDIYEISVEVFNRSK